MRTLLLSLIAAPALSLFAPQLAAQALDLDQVLTKYFEARGGLARIRALRSLHSEGTLRLGPMALQLKIDNPRGAFRSDTSVQGFTKVEAFDGREGWIDDPFTEPGQGPHAMSAAQLRQMALQMDFDGPFVDAEAKGNCLSLAGMERVKGAEAYVIRVRLKDGNQLRSYLDAATFMEVKAVNTAVANGKEVEVETLLGDYRPVKGVLLPFHLEIRLTGHAEGMEIRFDRVEADLPMEEARFRRPR
jgi:hypothetical protein